MDKMLTRETILSALKAALEPLDYVNAMWEGGAAAFNRVDDWSDIDLQIDVADGRVADALAVVESTLRGLSPIDLRYELPQPIWHGHFQAFYRFAQASPFLLLDFVIIQHGNPNKFLEKEIHGKALVHFDKCAVVQAAPMDVPVFLDMLKQRVETLRVTFEMYQVFPQKEIERGNAVEALSYYYGMILRPLVELLRIVHCPQRYNFHTRYVYYELPEDIVRRLESLYYLPNMHAIPRAQELASRLFADTLAALDWNAIAAALSAAAQE